MWNCPKVKSLNQKQNPGDRPWSPWSCFCLSVTKVEKVFIKLHQATSLNLKLCTIVFFKLPIFGQFLLGSLIMKSQANPLFLAYLKELWALTVWNRIKGIKYIVWWFTISLEAFLLQLFYSSGLKIVKPFIT